MNNIEISTLAKGKYALKRQEVLKNHAPSMFNAMVADGSLDEHLANIQSMASGYVDGYIESYKQSAEYKAAEASDPYEAARLLNMSKLEAEDSAYRIWIASIPENDEEEEAAEYDEDNEIVEMCRELIHLRNELMQNSDDYYDEDEE